MDTRNDLKISTCGLLAAAPPELDAVVVVDEREGVAVGVDTVVVEEDRLEFKEPPESGGSV
jgi:hypothetical protein